MRVIMISSVSSRLTSFCKLQRLYFKELANPAKTTPSQLILNPNSNRICLTSFESSFNVFLTKNFSSHRIYFSSRIFYLLQRMSLNRFGWVSLRFRVKFVNIHPRFIMLYIIFKYYKIAPKIGILANGLLGPSKSPFPS